MQYSGAKRQTTFCIHAPEIICHFQRTLVSLMITQDDNLGEGQSFGIAVIDHALSPVILSNIFCDANKFFENDTFRSNVIGLKECRPSGALLNNQLFSTRMPLLWSGNA